MQFISRPSWYVRPQAITDPSIYRQRKWHRRQFLQALGIGGAGLCLSGGLNGCAQKPTEAEVSAAGDVPVPVAPGDKVIYPSQRSPLYAYGRPETEQLEAATYTNFYEFTGPTTKQAYRFVEKFQPSPWVVEVDGLCDHPMKFDMDDLYREFDFEERAYRHRCVETWAMCVPWTGFALADLLVKVQPKATATHVRFETFHRPDEARYVGLDDSFPWPYIEGLKLSEALNELTFLATGIYGEPLPKQHGSPIRLVVPWKYGFKCIKSIVKITLTDQQPATFWNTVAPREYDFPANVNPEVPHPRWSQKTEWMLGTMERFPTEIYNGYGDSVGGLYA